MKREMMALALVLAAGAQPASGQSASLPTPAARSLAPVAVASVVHGERGPARGFVYSGSLADGGGPLRWADYPTVSHVFSGSPAEAAGLRAGDAILEVNGRDGTETTAYHGRPRAGDTYTLVVQRGLQRLDICFVVVEPTWPASEWSPPAGSYRTP